MIERDYIKRIIQQFFEVLGAVLNKAQRDEPSLEHTHQQLNDLCLRYIQTDLDSLLHLPIAEFNAHIAELTGQPTERSMANLTMLAELLYHHATLMPQCTAEHLSKALYALQQLDHSSQTFSLVRQQRIAALKAMKDKKACPLT